MTAHGNRVVAWATEARIPVMYPADSIFRNPTIAFGSSLVAAAGRMAHLVDRVLKGASPGDLPIEVVTRHSLIVNLAAARRIGLTIPTAVLARAVQVIE
jgi:putative ABC transport system substrate-binding protein